MKRTQRKRHQRRSCAGGLFWSTWGGTPLECCDLILAIKKGRKKAGGTKREVQERLGPKLSTLKEDSPGQRSRWNRGGAGGNVRGVGGLGAFSAYDIAETQKSRDKQWKPTKKKLSIDKQTDREQRGV